VRDSSEASTNKTTGAIHAQSNFVASNADLFTHSVIVNTATDRRRWEYDFSVTASANVDEIKSRIVEAIRSTPGTLPDPAPEALIFDLSDLKAGLFKIRALWWTRGSRQHEMLISYDAVLTAIDRALRGSGERATKEPQAA
jgi:small-conductance mechanosensitive channel